ncbi:aconitate hydratase AcnA [Kitasatospora sp. NPDC008050]|uniref:aconitate hydratase AcnA n=1 Tax=Kitasatospora sp. NPDC008050 TaxID=3364021 RepID=UPI0036E8AFBE
MTALDVPGLGPLHSLPHCAEQAGFELDRLPYTGRILLEALLRAGDPERAALLGKRLAAGQDPQLELAFTPARILVQDYTGIPLLVDLAALRERAGDPAQVRPALPVDVVVDHSVQTDVAGRADARVRNEALELRRNHERYAFLKWAESAFAEVRVIPPGQGIVHQVNLEQLATVVATGRDGVLFPDTVIGTDSHTTMVNGLGVLGWGVGGLEAKALMLGLAQPIRVPAVVGVRLTGALRPGVLATDLVLTLTQRLRAAQVTGLLLEFTGPGVDELSAADRCTIANMAPEYGAMAAYFPVDAEVLRYLRQTGRAAERTDLVERYCRYQHLLREGAAEPVFGRVIEVDLAEVEPSLAGPSRPHQRIPLAQLPASFAELCPGALTGESGAAGAAGAAGLRDGDLAIAAITSCTSTSNPKAMLAAGLLARRAVERGLTVPAHVKTSLSPGSRAVTRYLEQTGLLPYLEQLGFQVAGYGCMTCNGGSGPLAEGVGEAVDEHGLTLAAVLSGNRNFEARVHAQVRAGYLASPALVVALALAGHVRIDLDSEPLGTGSDGRPVHLAELWPQDRELAELAEQVLRPEVFAESTAPQPGWAAIEAQQGEVYAWDEESSYIRRPSYLDAAPAEGPLRGARVLLAVGDDVSTDHISPVGSIPAHSPAGAYLRERGVREFNSYGSRRGNHEVMARGAFSNPRLVNHLLGEGPGDGGGRTLHLPSGERLPVFEAAERYAAAGTPLLVLAGRNYGMGSSRDWAAKGPWLLGVRAVLAESFERIHRANLCAMGILPLLLPAAWAELGLTGHEEYALDGLAQAQQTGRVEVRADGRGFQAVAAVNSPGEWQLLRAGGTLPHLLGRLS